MRLFRLINQVDLQLFRRAAESDTPVLDEILPRLSRAANKSVLWFGMAGILWAVGGRFGRRAAGRALVSIGITSPIANLAGKLLTRRPRPLLDDVPLARRLPHAPSSTSFPSGHSSSAFAFATGATLEAPYLAIPLGSLAASVAYSRIHTGVHYPTDVAAGALLGTAGALATRTFWPVAPSEGMAPRDFTTTDLEPRPTGAGVHIIVNKAAGAMHQNDIKSILRDNLPEARIQEVEDVEGGELNQAIESAAAGCDVIGIYGGDGSIACAAQAAVDHRKPLMIIPGGTLNHLARDIGLDDAVEAIEAVKKGKAIVLDVGMIDGRTFLNAASFGAYAHLVDIRERFESTIGKWPALALALVRLLRRGRPIEVEIDGARRKIWMMFIGNCRYHPSGFAPAWRKTLDDGQLDIRFIDASAGAARTRLVASILTGRLGKSRIYEQRLAPRVTVASLGHPLRLARDGETFDGRPEFVVEKLPERLALYALPA